MARLALHLLGPFYVTLDGVDIDRFGYDHVRALLAYLAVEADRPHRRQALAALLWPDQSDPSALEQLRQALYRLQQAIGNRQASPPFLLISRHTLQFNPQSDHVLDVWRFQTLIATPPDAEDGVLRLEQAVELARGSFLQGFSLSGSYAFEEWLLHKREQLDQQMAAALHHLARIYQARGEDERIAACAQRLLALDPWDEPTHRQLMSILAMQGRRGAALAQYYTLRARLQQEFGVEPEPETMALQARISAGQLDALAREPRLAPTPQPFSPAPTPFVGREPQLQHLSRCLDRALSGQGQVAFVTGQAGSGKSTLLAEFARRAMATYPQLVVACGSCTAQRGIGDPYLPFRELLQSLCGDVSIPLPNGQIPRVYADRQWAIAPSAIQALVEVGPDLIHRLLHAGPLGLRAEALAHQRPDVSTQSPWLAQLEALIKRPLVASDAAQVAQVDLFAQYAHVLYHAAHARPLLLLLDDLHWADVGTISLLFHLGRRLAGHPILLLGAYRDDQVAAGLAGQRHPLEPVANELRRGGDDGGVDLAQAEGQGFVAALLDSEPNRLGDAFRQTLYRHTGGHALFAVELLRSLKAGGGLQYDHDGHWVEGPTLDWQTLPPRVEVTIAERMAQLSAAQRALLDAASVEGEIFTAEVVGQVCGMTPQEARGCLSRELGARMRLVRAEELGWQGVQPLCRYRFQHQLFQRYLYDALDPVERAYLHGAVLKALEALYGAHVEPIAGTLARHAEVAGLDEQAARYWLQAGQRALRLSAHDEAVALLQRGLAALRQLPESPERDRCELEAQLALSSPLFVAQGWGADMRAAAADRAYALSVALGDSDHRLPLLVMLANLSVGRFQCQRAQALSQELVELAQARGDTQYLAIGYQLLGLSRLACGDLIQSQTYLRRALASRPGEANRREAVVIGLGIDMQVNLNLWLSYGLWLMGFPEQAQQHLTRALAVAERLAHPPTVAGAMAMRCAYLAAMGGHLAEVLACSQRLLHLADQNGLFFARPWGAIYYSWSQVMTDQGEAAIPQLEKGLEALRQTGTLATEFQMHTLLAEGYLHLGQADKGLAVITQSLDHAEACGTMLYNAEMWRIKGELLSLKGHRAEAVACYERAIALARQQKARTMELRAATSWHRLAPSPSTRRILAQVYDWFSEGHDTPDLQRARRCLDAG